MSYQQPPYGNQPPHGQQPGYSPMGGFPQQQVLTKPPQSIRIAQIAMAIGAVLTLLATPLAMLIQWDELKAETTKSLIADGTYDPGMVDTIMWIVVIAAAGVTLVLALLWVLMAWLAGRGAEWSRIVGSVLFGLYAVLTLCSLAGLPDPLTLVSNCVMVVCGLVATVFLWMKDSTAWFKQPRV